LILAAAFNLYWLTLQLVFSVATKPLLYASERLATVLVGGNGRKPPL
jgi:hypothetical protein